MLWIQCSYDDSLCLVGLSEYAFRFDDSVLIADWIKSEIPVAAHIITAV